MELAWFEWDGSLMDIWVAPTVLTDWQAAYEWLFLNFDTSYESGGRLSLPPADVEHCFSDPSSVLRVKVGRMSVNVHFFDESEMELDVDPRECDEAALPTLKDFMEALGRALSKPVNLSGEGSRVTLFTTAV